MSDTKPQENDNATQESTTSSEVPVTTQGETSDTTFTQADVDRIVGERAKRAKEAARKELLESLGFESADGLQALVEESKARQEAEMSEVEKALKQVDQAKQEAETYKQQLAEMQAQQIASTRDNALKAALRSAGATDENSLAILMGAQMSNKIADAFDETGAPIAKQLEALVKEAQSSYEMFFKSAGAGNPSQAGGVAPNNRQVTQEKAAKAVAKKFGSM